PRPLLLKDAFGDVFLRSRPPLLWRRGIAAGFTFRPIGHSTVWKGTYESFSVDVVASATASHNPDRHRSEPWSTGRSTHHLSRRIWARRSAGQLLRFAPDHSHACLLRVPDALQHAAER